MTGRYYEELTVGERIEHPRGRTLTEMDNVLFSALTMNTQPLHLDEPFAAQTEFGERIVNGLFTLGLAVGMTIPELTEGTLLANLSYEEVEHPHPLFHGDTLYVVSEVVSKRESRSRPGVGIVQFAHEGRNQTDTIVIRLRRTALMLMRDSKGD